MPLTKDQISERAKKQIRLRFQSKHLAIQFNANAIYCGVEKD